MSGIKGFAVMGLACLLQAAAAGACQPDTSERFEPVSGQRFYSSVPAPVVKVVSVTRATSDTGMTCDDAGILVLSVSLPEGSLLPLGKFGVYFRVLRGESPDRIFPDIPLSDEVQDGEMRIMLAWLHGEAQNQPIWLEVEAFLVGSDLSIGPSTVFWVKG